MAETEVESILREIRERVLAGQRASKDPGVRPSVIAKGGNGSGASDPLQLLKPDDSETPSAEHLSLINSYLTTTARAWDRLPPVVSNRSGLIARVELWLKRQLKRSTHWFTWEQVNFNAAVHHTLRELLPVVSAQEQELQRLRAQVAETAAELTRLEAQRGAINTRLDGLLNELRERDAHLRDEQRVCFKQLALETSEATVLEDRARRKTEALLEELQGRIDQLEKTGE